jgi:hypothetical protein
MANGSDGIFNIRNNFKIARATHPSLAVEAFNDLLKKHGKRQSVENPLLD